MDTPEAATIGQRLRATRQARGLRQIDLALRAGVAANTVAVIERERTHWPHMATLQRLAAVLGVSAHWLRYGAERPPGGP
jgi:transcriptional regulator with XRE-family HTH domain